MLTLGRVCVGPGEKSGAPRNARTRKIQLLLLLLLVIGRAIFLPLFFQPFVPIGGNVTPTPMPGEVTVLPEFSAILLGEDDGAV